MQKYILITITTALILSLILCLVLFVYIRRQNRELRYINGILKEINAGNRNRKILLDTDSILADIGFGINLLLQDSQDTIIALQKAEEAEKALMTSLSHDRCRNPGKLCGDSPSEGVCPEKLCGYAV